MLFHHHPPPPPPPPVDERERFKELWKSVGAYWPAKAAPDDKLQNINGINEVIEKKMIEAGSIHQQLKVNLTAADSKAMAAVMDETWRNKMKMV